MTTNLKKALLDKCIQLVNERIENNKRSMNETQDAANEEVKSSSGDKYETGRAMMHLEQEKTAAQFQETMKLKVLLDKIDITSDSETIHQGSVVTTNNGIFFLAAALGQVTLENQVYFVISSVSPLGKELLDKKAGESVIVNGRTFKISKVT